MASSLPMNMATMSADSKFSAENFGSQSTATRLPQKPFVQVASGIIAIGEYFGQGQISRFVISQSKPSQCHMTQLIRSDTLFTPGKAHSDLSPTLDMRRR